MISEKRKKAGELRNVPERGTIRAVGSEEREKKRSYNRTGSCEVAWKWERPLLYLGNEECPLPSGKGETEKGAGSRPRSPRKT